MGESSIKFEPVDVLKLQLIGERQRRIAAETDRMRADSYRLEQERKEAGRETDSFFAYVQKTYGLDLRTTQVSLNVETGEVTPAPQQGQQLQDPGPQAPRA